MRSPGARSWLSPLLLLVPCALLLGRAWLPGWGLAHGDLLIYFPTLHQAPWQGSWNSWVSLGTPALANPQTGAFYPPAWLLAVDYARALPFYLFLHFVLAALGTWLWVKQATSERVAPWLAGISYACGGAAWSLATKLDKLPGFALLPFVLLGIGWLVGAGEARRRAQGWLLSVLSLALIWLGGSVEGLFIAVLAAAGWASLLPGAERGALALLRRVGWCAAVLVAALAVIACSLLPLWLVLAQTNRSGGLDPAQALEMSLHLEDLLRWLLPADLAAVGGRQHYLPSVYGGVFALSLLLLGLLPRGAMPGRRVALAGLLAFLFLALGEQNPVVCWLYGRLPLLATIRYPEKFWLGTLPFQAWLVARGWCLLAARMERWGARARWIPALAMLLLAGDLCLNAWQLYPAVRWGDVFAPSPASSALLADAPSGGPPLLWDESLQQLGEIPAPRPGESYQRMLQQVLYPNIGVQHGIAYLFGSNAFRLERPERLLKRAVAGSLAERRALVRLAGASHWLVWDQQQALILARALGLEPVPAAPGEPLPVGLLADPSPLPRLQWLPAWRTVESFEAVLERLALGEGEDLALLVAGDPGVEDLPSAAGASADSFELTVLEAREDRYHAGLQVPAPGVLLLRQAWAPGWTAAVDGGPAVPALRVQGALLGAAVPAGEHEVLLRYRPAGLLPGLAVSLLGLLATLVVGRGILRAPNLST